MFSRWSARGGVPVAHFTKRFYTQQRAELAHEVFTARSSSVPVKHTAVVMHGILGSHKNLRQFSRKFCEAYPSFQMLLVTHRNHGESGTGGTPHNLKACAKDVLHLYEQLGLVQNPPEIVIGHSFGGRVALQLLQTAMTGPGNVAPARHTWVLDSLPGNMSDLNSNARLATLDSVVRVLSELRSIRLPIQSKQDLVKQLTDKGLPLGIANWMTTNIKPTPNGAYTWSFNLDNILLMFHDMLDKDFAPFLETHASPDAKVHFVQAEKNTTLWTEKQLVPFHRSSNPNITLNLLKNSGHWVHVDNPQDLQTMMMPTFEEIHNR